MSSTRVLGLFAKLPRPGQVKTRLAADTSPEWAAQVADAFLRDLIDRLAAVEAERVIAFDPPAAEAEFASIAQGRFTLEAQVSGHLGRRLAAFLTNHLPRGPVVVLGTDSPTVPLEHIEQAFHALERADVVLGPATDGGYYLLGCAHRLLPLFEGIAWSTPHVLAETVARLADPAWGLALLPPWYDVDTLDDWRMLRGHLAALRRAGIDPGLPRTEQLSPPS